MFSAMSARAVRPEGAGPCLRAPVFSCPCQSAQRHSTRTHHRLSTRTRAAEQALRSRTQSQPDSARLSSGPLGRTLVFAVDGTEDGEQACKWLVDTFCRSGDTVHLCYVLCNERSVPTSLGSSGRRDVLDAMDEDFGAEKRKAYIQRKQQEVQNMMTAKFVPMLNCGQVQYRIDIVIANGRKSAATIGEKIVGLANEVQADALVVASHGLGLLADYGSVARYVVQHFAAPVILLPPRVNTMACKSSTNICVAINSVAELQDAAWWALRNIFRNNVDKLHVVHIQEETLKAGSATDQVSIMLGLSEQVKKHRVNDMELQQIPQDLSLSGEARNSAAAGQVLKQIATNEDRMLVMVNYASQGMMQEMMLGSLAMHCSRNAKIPLVLVPPGLSHS